LTAPAQHPIFEQFAPYEGWAEPGFERGYYGMNIRDWIYTGMSKGYTSRRFVHVDHPPVDEEYFEWITLLTAIAHADRQFCIAELGAGWGRWITASAVLCRRKSIDFSLIGVEAEPFRFNLMEMVLRDNLVDPEDHDLLRAAVAARDGEVFLAGNDDRREIYSHQMIQANEVLEWQNLPGYVIRSVPAYSLQTVCATHPFIDLLDIDVQGAEYEILASSFRAVSFKVGMIHIGTHSEEIEEALRTLFGEIGWLEAFDFPCHRAVDTRFGTANFVDGVQTWVNPNRPELHAALVEG
jgi:FkbM family methyltransferase